MRLILVSVVLFVASVSSAEAEFWRCAVEEGRSGSVFTNTPVATKRSPCRAVSVENSALTKIPAASFPFPTNIEPKLRRETTLEPEGVPSILTSWTASELRQKDPQKPVNIFNRGCRLVGVARSSRSGRARVTVTRGALTVTEMPLIVGKRTPWKLELSGRCRNPVVEIELQS